MHNSQHITVVHVTCDKPHVRRAIIKSIGKAQTKLAPEGGRVAIQDNHRDYHQLIIYSTVCMALPKPPHNYTRHSGQSLLRTNQCARVAQYIYV